MKPLTEFLVNNRVQQLDKEFPVYECTVTFKDKHQYMYYVKIENEDDFAFLTKEQYDASLSSILNRLQKDKYIISSDCPLYIRPGIDAIMWEVPDTILYEEQVDTITKKEFTYQYWKDNDWNKY